MAIWLYQAVSLARLLNLGLSTADPKERELCLAELETHAVLSKVIRLFFGDLSLILGMYGD